MSDVSDQAEIIREERKQEYWNKEERRHGGDGVREWAGS